MSVDTVQVIIFDACGLMVETIGRAADFTVGDTVEFVDVRGMEIISFTGVEPLVHDSIIEVRAIRNNIIYSC